MGKTVEMIALVLLDVHTRRPSASASASGPGHARPGGVPVAVKREAGNEAASGHDLLPNGVPTMQWIAEHEARRGNSLFAAGVDAHASLAAPDALPPGAVPWPDFATLIVVPLALLDQWRGELAARVAPGGAVHARLTPDFAG